MSANTITPSCLGFFEPLATECQQCLVTNACLKHQYQLVKGAQPMTADSIPEDAKLELKEATAEEEDKEQTPEPEEEPDTDTSQVIQAGPGVQIIPRHQRAPLEMPALNTKISAIYKNREYRAVIGPDPENLHTGGRSVIFKGKTYKTLTAAARAIHPSINSGRVWAIAQ